MRTLPLALAVLLVACQDITIRDAPELEGDEPGECEDDADNDADSLFDCDDPDCAGASVCQGDDDDSGDDDDDDSGDDDDSAIGDDDDDDSATGDDDDDDDDDSAIGDDDDDSAAITNCSALHFDGTLDQVEILQDASLAIGGPITVELWVRPEAGVVNNPWWPNLIGKRNSNNAFPTWVLGLNPSIQPYTVLDNGWATANPTVALNAWQHLAFVWDGSNATLFLDGVPSSMGSGNSLGPQNTENVYLGTLPDNTQNFQGDIASVRVSNGARYSAPFVPAAAWVSDADTALLLPLEEGSGPMAYDDSANANDGLIVGATWIGGLPAFLCAP